MSPEANLSAHLQPAARSVDFTAPGLMLAANVSLVLGYLWVGWLSPGLGAGGAAPALRDGVLPAVVAVAVFGVRKNLPGSSFLLPLMAGALLTVTLAAALSGIRTLGLIAGVMALVVALAAIASVLFREKGTRQSAWQDNVVSAVHQ